MQRSIILPSCIVLSIAAFDCTAAGESAEGDRGAPPGVEQLLERGAIPAIVDPTFVDASQASIAPDAWILGVDLGGEPRAYSLNLLNRHEVVNDRVGEKTFAAVW